MICYLLYWALVEYMVLPYMDPGGIRAIMKNNYIKNVIPRDEVDYLIMGDSTAFYAINPARLSKKSYNAAQPGSSMTLTKNTFANLNIKKINKGIIISQTFINPHYDEDIWKVFVPQKMMGLNDVLDVFCQKKCSFSEKSYWIIKYFWYRIHLNAYAASTVSYGLSIQFNSSMRGFATHIEENLITHQGHYAAKKKYTLDNNFFYSAYWKNFTKPIDPPTSELQSLKELADLAKLNGIRVFLIQPQLYRAEKMINLQQYTKSYQDFIKSRPDLGIEYIDYKKFNLVLDKSHYRDISHLNENGANKVTDALKYYIENSQKVTP